MREVRAVLERLANETPLHLRLEDRPPRPRLEVGELRRALRDYLADKDDGAAAWPIPFSRLRDATDGGIRPGELWIVGGWTSHAKSVLADMVLDSAADAGARCHLYMSEMTLVQRGLRALARRSGVLDPRALRRRELTDGQYAVAEDTIARLPYGISVVRDWTPRQVALDIAASRTQVAVVDHLHDFHYRDERELTQYLSEFTAAIGSDAAGLHGGSAVVLCAQLNESQMRDSRSGELPRPGLHSLKGASAIKQKADIVMFTWLETDEDGLPLKDDAGMVNGEVWIAKGRNGGAGGRQRIRLDTTTLALRERFM